MLQYNQIMIKNNLYRIILTYVEYILPKRRYKLSYEELSDLTKSFLGKRYTIPTLRKELSILRHTGLIASRMRYRKKVDVLSVDGKMFIAPALPKMKNEPWDGKWRVIVCNIPAGDKYSRKMLAEKLSRLGFKKIFRATYLSPHKHTGVLHRYATELGIRQYVLLFEAETLGMEAHAAQRAWKLDAINGQYRRFIASAKKSLKKTNDKYWPLTAKRIEQKFIAVYSQDPNFPDELLPSGWLAPRAHDYFKKIINSYK